jgi:hypothetical protein
VGLIRLLLFYAHVRRVFRHYGPDESPVIDGSEWSEGLDEAERYGERRNIGSGSSSQMLPVIST